MKKSTAYRIAQLAVLEDIHLTSNEKLDILAVLMSDEALAKFQEGEEVKE